MVLPVFAFINTGISVIVSYIVPLFLLIIIGLCMFLDNLETFLANKHYLPDPVRRLLRKGFLSASVIVLFSSLSLMTFYRHVSSEEFRQICNRGEFLLKETGSWLRENSEADSTVMSRWSNIGYYGDRRWTGLVDGSIWELITYAKKNRIKYVVIDSVSIYRRPNLAQLLSAMPFGTELIPVYDAERYGVKVVIYRIG